MKLPLETVITATRAHLGNAVANALPGALRAMYRLEALPAQIDDRCLGEALFRAIVGRAGDEPAVALRAVMIVAAGAQRSLDPDDAEEHPLVGPWVEATLTGALAAPLIAGARAANLAMGAPVYGGVQIIEVEGLISGTATLFFAADGVGVVVICLYGEDPMDAPVVVSRTLSGTALFQIGADAGALPIGSPPTPPSASSVAIVSAGSGAVH